MERKLKDTTFPSLDVYLVYCSDLSIAPLFGQHVVQVAEAKMDIVGSPIQLSSVQEGWSTFCQSIGELNNCLGFLAAALLL